MWFKAGNVELGQMEVQEVWKKLWRRTMKKYRMAFDNNKEALYHAIVFALILISFGLFFGLPIALMKHGFCLFNCGCVL